MIEFYKRTIQDKDYLFIKRHRYLFILFFIFLSVNVNAQIAVTPNQTATQLVQKLVGSGVTVANPVLTCPTVANGTFATTSSNLGLKGGILITTGTAANAVGAASLGASTSNNAAGDADLTNIINATTRDACVLEFDFVPTGDTVKFRYVFGSKEYPGYACTNFNDVFAFFISGPGITGTKNIALIPGTTIAVAINSTSGVVGTSGGNITTCNAMGTGSPFTQYYVNNATGTTVRYSGFTTIFTALATVIPCNTYHLKLAIADAIDGAFDSGVFLEEGSLTSNELEVSTKSNIQAPVPYCVRGCKNGTFNFKRQKVSPYPLTVKYLISGTGVNGVDYTMIPDSVVIPANDSVATRTIIPLTTASGSKTVKLYVFSPFSCTTPIIIDSSEIAIFDSLYAQIATPDTAVCPGTPGQIITIGDDSLVYSWTPSLGLSSSTAKSPFALPATPTTYYLTATLPNSTCTPIHDQINVGINPPTVINTEPPFRVVCVGENTTFGLSASGNMLTYQWQLSTGGNFTNLVNNATYSGISTNTLSVTNAIATMNGYKYRCIVSGQCQPKDTSIEVTLTVNIPPALNSQPVNEVVCEGSNTGFTVTASGSGLNYQWMVDDGSGFVNVPNASPYAGVNTATLKINSAPFLLNGYLYKCIITAACTPVLTTDTVSLTVNELVALSAQPVNENICTGDNALFSVTASGTGLIYQWQVNDGSGFTNLADGGIYSGSNTSALNITTATTAVDGYWYRCLITGTCLPDVLSDSAKLSVATPPAITSQPTNTPICDGGTTIFSIGATGTNLTYQWQVNTGGGYINISNGGVYSGANTSALVITGVTPAMSGYLYQCIISGDCPPVVTSGALTLVLTVFTLPSVTSHPLSSTICEGDNTSFSITANGSGISYQWNVDDGTGYVPVNNGGIYSGANTPTLSIAGATKDMSGYRYVCVVPGTCLPDAVSDPGVLGVDTIPVVTKGPIDTTVCDGAAASFTVSADGTGKTYQWQLNNGLGFNNIPNSGIYSGANTATLHISSATAAMEGYQYRCIVGGICPPAATSPTGVLHIDILPAITANPADSAICYGGNVGFSALAIGTDISYQWEVNSGSGFTAITDNSLYSGTTTHDLLITGVSASMNGYLYRCVANGKCTPSAPSSAALLTVYTAPHVTVNPQEALICQLGNTSFSISATGEGLTYQWQLDFGTGYNNIANNAAYSGAQTNTLTITSAAASMNNNSYRCIVSGTCAPNDTSAGALIKVNILPTLVSQPHDSTICEGWDAAFSFVGTGTNIHFQWQVNTGTGYQDINNGGVYTGVNTNKLLITNGPASMSGYKYRCVLTGDCTPAAITNEVTFTVNTEPNIIADSRDTTICEGNVAAFNVVTTGSQLTYVWQVDEGSGFGNISNNALYSGADAGILTITNPPASMSGYRYRCLIAGVCQPDIVSRISTLTIYTLPIITAQPHDSVLCEGADAMFAINATGTNISYQWQVDAGSGFVNVADNAIYSGSLSNTLSLTVPPASMNNYRYRCVVSGSCTPQAISDEVVLTVNSLPIILSMPRDSLICEGNNAAFILQAGGTALTYRWQVDDGNGYTNVADDAIYSGSATAILLLTSPPHAMNGYKYRCILSGICPPADTTQDAELTIYELPVIIDNPINKIVCEGDDLFFASPATGTNIGYQWEVNTGSGFVALSDGGVYNGVHTDTLKISGAIASMDGNIYRCYVFGSCPPAQYSGQASLTVNILPLITLQPHDSTICTGNNASFSTSAVGTNISYQWQVDDGNGFTDVVNGGIYSGANTPTLNITAATTLVDSFRFRCIVPGICMPDAITDTVGLYISTPPVIVTPPASTPICDGGTTIFNVVATGTNLQYQWQLNTGSGYTNINNGGVYSGANSANLVISNVSPAMTGYQYQCVVSGDCPPSVTSGALTLVLTVYTLPAITVQPANSNVTICEGGNTSFGISAIGSGISYQWEVDAGTGFTVINNGGVYAGANTPMLNITNATHDMSGYIYRCVVPGICLPDAISNPVNLRVDTIPAVLTGPLDTTVCDGQPASFEIAAIGTNNTYQWQINTGVGFSNVPNSGIYSGANTTTLHISSATAGMEGYQYRCVINGKCSPPATSAIGLLHIRLLPTIVTPPANTVVCDGDDAYFNIVATGTGLVYQWEEDAGSGFTVLTDNAVYSGTSTANLQVAAVPPSMSGYQYRCIVSGDCVPQAVSTGATLTVNTLPDITMQAHDSLICDGGNASFNIAATGTGITYQWQVDAGAGYNNVSGGVYTGITTNTLVITGGTAAMHGYHYRCIVNGVCTPPDTSLPVTLMVNTLPTVTLQPHDSTICDGGSAAFILNGTGTGVTYQWQINTGSGFTNLSNGGVYSGAATNTLQVTGGTPGMSGYQYRCILTGACTPPATSNSALLIVNTPPALTLQPHDSTICDGGNAAFIIAATGTALTYQWQINTGSGFINLPNGGIYSGATTNTLQITGGTAAMNGYEYQCVVSGVCPPAVTSAKAALFINTLPAIVTHPKDSTICDGNDASFEITATGTGITYQWQVNTGSGFTNIVNNALYSGAATSVLTLTAANAAMHNYEYRCIVSGVCTPPAMSNMALLKVNTLPDITMQPHDSTVCEWLDVSFEISATGTGITYQWQVDNGSGYFDVTNNSFYSGATTNKLVMTGVPHAMDGFVYHCIVTGTCTPPDTSADAIVYVNTSPVVTMNPANSIICEGTNTDYKITATGAGLLYQWQVNTGSSFTSLANGTLYSGVNSNVLSITAATAGMNNYLYRCIVYGTCTPPDTSLPASLTIYKAPVITQQPVNVSLCPRTPAMFAVAATGTTLTYQWQVDNGAGFADITNGSLYTGATSVKLDVLNTDKTMNNYKYRCVVSGACTPNDTSAIAILSIYPEATPAITTDKLNATMCAGETIVMTGSPATGVTYQWQKDNKNIAGATAVTHTTMTGGVYKLVVHNDFCYTTSDSVIVVVNPLPASSFYLEGLKVICPDSEVVLRAVQILQSTYQWKYNGADIPGGISMIHKTRVPGLYSLQVTNNYGCSAMSEAREILSDPGPDPRITASDIILCTGNFKAYQWFRYSDSVLTATTACFAPKSNALYSVFVTNDNGCSKLSDPYAMERVGHDYVLISPNPASTVVNINTSLVVNVVLATIDGKILLRQDRAKQIDISGFADGEYMLWIFDQNNDAVRAERIVKISGK